MKSNKKNVGMKMTEHDLEELIASKQVRLSHQKERKEKLEKTIENNQNDIEQLKYTLQVMKRNRKRQKPSTFIPHKQIAAFFARISGFFTYLTRRLHRIPNYTWFCLLLTSRFSFESRTRTDGHKLLAPGTVLGYFKRERIEL